MVNTKIDLVTSEKILQAAKHIFLQKGKAGARMQDIADEAGINKALLHYYFRNKELLFETVFQEEAKKFFPKINMIFEADIPLFEKIHRFVDEYLDEMQQNPLLPLFIINQINQEPDLFIKNIFSKAGKPKPHALLTQIEQEVKKGLIKPIQPIQLLMNLLSMCIFPYMGKPMLTRIIGISDQQFTQLMEQRRKEIPEFIINAIKR